MFPIRNPENSNMPVYKCWICDMSGVGSLEKHYCTLQHVNNRIGQFLKTNEGQFMTYMAKKMIDGSNQPDHPLH